MAWSTSEIAHMASTTVNTVRHYHRLGLLDEPERRFNGYKQYGVRHLVRLLQIRRLVALGLPLGRIAEVSADGDGRQDVLREVDADLVAGIERLERARADLAAILREDAPADAPAGFESLSSRLSVSDRSILHISGQFYDAQAMADLRRMIEVDDTMDRIGTQLNGLPADADETTRERLVRLLVPVIEQQLTEYPWLLNQSAHLSKSESVVRRTLLEALAELYNPAQLDVIDRASQTVYDMRKDRNDAAEDDRLKAPAFAR